jgi:hypothetical protein
MGLGKGFTKETFKVGLRDEYVFWWNRGVGHIKHVIPGKTQLYYLLIIYDQYKEIITLFSKSKCNNA